MISADKGHKGGKDVLSIVTLPGRHSRVHSDIKIAQLGECTRLQGQNQCVRDLGLGLNVEIIDSQIQGPVLAHGSG